MPLYKAPTSDKDRLNALEKSAENGTKDIAAGRKSITQETLDAIVAFLVIFKPLYDALTRTLTGRMKEVREREEARAKLDTYVRDFWEVLKRRAHRLGQPAEMLVYYGLTSDGTVPTTLIFDDLVAAADAIVKGEADAITAGFPPMSNPSVAELAPVLANARLQAADVPTADRNYTDAQTAIAAQRPTADELIADGMTDLRSSLRRLDDPGQRRIMRNYGATFDTLPGEPADPTPGPTPGPTPPPAPGNP